VEWNSKRTRFIAALGLYLIWVIALAATALTSAERPPSTHSTTAASDEVKAPGP
jgi:hypothetical protein